jgi:hypothetical protein
MPTAKTQAGRHWLLPHERWLGRFAGRVENPPPGGKRWRFQQNYGPEGDVFLTAYLADMVAAFFLCIAGIVFLDVPKAGPLVTVGGCILGIGILTGPVGMVRAVQLVRAGRVFRAGRPLVH